MHPIIRNIFEGAWPDGVSFNAVAKRSGVSANAIRAWHRADRLASPRLENVDAVLGAMGLRLAVEPINATETIWFQRSRRPA